MPLSLGACDQITVTSSSSTAVPSGGMVSGAQYRLTSNTDCWVALGTAPTASVAGANCHLLLKGQVMLLANVDGATKVALIRDTADGKATLSVIET